ncbi:phosphatase and actin regulator 2 [Trichonephila clavipes]|nr:phosphatase and actin regulator 2 [Trichonephila clavipes]
MGIEGKFYGHGETGFLGIRPGSKNFDFDQSLEREQKPSVEETRRHFPKNFVQPVEKKQKIELTKLQLAKLEKGVELQTAKNKALSLNSAAKVEEKQFEILNKETATHIGIREAEDWFRPIDLAKECAHAYAYPSAVSFSNVSVSNVIENSSYDLPHVKNFNTRNDLSSLIKDYKCNKIKSTKLKLSIKREKCSDIVLCKKINGAMKTSSVNFNAPSPMESKHRRFTKLRKIFEPWQWKRRKKRNRFEQTSRTLQRKISMRSTKDQLVKKDVLMPVKHNVFLWKLPDVEEMPSHDGEPV